MRIFALLFCVGVCTLQGQAELSSAARALAVALLALALVGAVAALRAPPRWQAGLRGGALALFAVAAGFAWASLRAEWRLADELHAALEGVDVVVRGRVAELPRSDASGVRFMFALDEAVAGVPARISLSWQAGRQGRRGGAEPPPQLRAGERWQLRVRLQRPRGLANPGGFDYAAWLLQKGVRAGGYVRAGDAERLDAAPRSFMHHVHRARGEVRERFLAALGEAPYRGVLVALAVGDQQAITPAQWDSFRRTGIAHLVSISGLHVSLVASLAALAWGAWWRRVPALALRLPVRKAQALAALLAALSYAVLAGMGIPVLRALLMLAVVVAALFGARAAAPPRVLAAALLLVLLIDPWAVLAAGFWLSFAAVGVIAYVLGGRARRQTGWRAALRIQLAISVALVPALVLLFQSVPLLSPLANAFAIPLVSFVVAPLALAAVLLPADFLLHAAHAVTAAMMVGVEWLAGIDAGFWRQAQPPLWLGVAAAAAFALLILPRATPGKPAAVLVVLALLGWQAPRPPPGAFRALVLDVGQGLAVHVQTARHDLLFDAGPRFGSHADAGERALLPYLQAQGVSALDVLLLSHDDADHVGGADSVLGALPVRTLLAPAGGGGLLAAAERERIQPCANGVSWVWDGIEFDVLHPPPAHAAGSGAAAAGKATANDQSCVLRVRGAGGVLLLGADIGAAAEAALLATHGAEALASTVVVSPHHGSRSSSSPAFVEATAPEAVIHSAGYRNSFGHPHPQVWTRWAQAGARNWRTDGQGAIQVDFAAHADDGVLLRGTRAQEARYWHGR